MRLGRATGSSLLVLRSRLMRSEWSEHATAARYLLHRLQSSKEGQSSRCYELVDVDANLCHEALRNEAAELIAAAHKVCVRLVPERFS